MAVDPRFTALIRRQSVESRELFDQFLIKHPHVEIDNDDWTDEQERDWREMTAEHDAKCRQERDALNDLIDSG